MRLVHSTSAGGFGALGPDCGRSPRTSTLSFWLRRQWRVVDALPEHERAVPILSSPRRGMLRVAERLSQLPAERVRVQR
jgi:hypothetical protein